VYRDSFEMSAFTRSKKRQSFPANVHRDILVSEDRDGYFEAEQRRVLVFRAICQLLAHSDRKNA